MSFNKLLEMILEQNGPPLDLECSCGEKPPLESTCPEFCVCCMMGDGEDKLTGRPLNWTYVGYMYHCISDLASDDKISFC